MLFHYKESCIRSVLPFIAQEMTSSLHGFRVIKKKLPINNMQGTENQKLDVHNCFSASH